MSILPEINYLESGVQTFGDISPSKTFRIMFYDKRFGEYIDENEAIGQSLLLNLMTERYSYSIFDRDYGVETADLIGSNFETIATVLPHRIRESLMIDDRVVSIDDITVEEVDDEVEVTVIVSTVFTDNSVIRVRYNVLG